MLELELVEHNRSKTATVPLFRNPVITSRTKIGENLKITLKFPLFQKAMLTVWWRWCIGLIHLSIVQPGKATAESYCCDLEIMLEKL